MSAPDAPEQAPDPAIEYGVRWTRMPGHPPAVMPSTADKAEAQARRTRALQRVFGNEDDAAAVYREPGGEWTYLVPQYIDRLVHDFEDWLRSHSDPPPPIP